MGQEDKSGYFVWQRVGFILSFQMVPLECGGVAFAPPKPDSASDLDEGTFLSVHYFGPFCALQLSEYVMSLSLKALGTYPSICEQFGPLMVIYCQELFFLSSPFSLKTMCALIGLDRRI